MGKIMRNNIEYGGTESWTGTQAEYDALLIKYPNITYYITDTNGNEDQFQPVIYSLDEREIGVWTDGKPLYQKTYIYTPSAPLSVASLSIDKIIDMRAISHQTTGVADIAVPYGWDSSDRALFYYHPVNKTLNFSYSSMNSGEWYVTIRYTKTTDTAGSGTWTPQGVPSHHYSTSERVTGTWVDGRTICELVVDLGSQITLAQQDWYTTNIPNSDKAVILNARSISSSGMIFPLGCTRDTGSTLKIYNLRNTTVGCQYIILEYVKASS